MSDWKEYKLGELIKDIAAGPFGSNLKVECFVESGFPIIDGANLKGIKVTDNITKYVTEKKARSLHRAIAKRNDIVVTISGNVGQIAYIPDNSKYLEYLVSQRQFRATFDVTKVDVPFLVYYFHTRVGQHKILSFANQVGVPALAQPIKNFKEIELELPPINEQKRIARVLGSLDDKIDLLRRENATLEAMAETLFRQWFVVEAKEEWEEGKVIDLTKHVKDSINPQKYPNTVFQHYSIPAYDDGKKPTIETGENIQSNKYVIPQKSILFSKLNPHKDKRVWLMLDDVPDNAVCSTEFQIVKPNNSEYLYFMYGWLTFKDNYEEIASGVGGTSGSHQRIDPKSIFAFACPKVDVETIRNYNKKVEPLFYKQRNNQLQIQTLIQTRDGLLPRLMGGEIKI